MASENPLRQKMINMMYLVLTALLALNVSADILKAFGLVNRGLVVTNEGFASKNSFLMTQFEQLQRTNGKAKGPFDTATMAQNVAKEMFDELQAMKEDLAREADGWTDSLVKQSVNKESDLEIPQRYFIDDKLAKRGEMLRNKLAGFRSKMLALGDKNMEMGFTKDMLAANFTEKDGTKKKWEEYYFEGKPVVAAITLLSKFQTDVKSAETDVIQFNIKKVGALDFKFDRLKAWVNIQTPNAKLGDKVKAEVVIAAYDSKNVPSIIVGGRELRIDGGVGLYEGTANALGAQRISGVAKLKGPDGEIKELPFSSEYQVYTGSATISPVKMNMLYVGLDNPVNVSVPGARPEQIVVTSSAPGIMRMIRPGEYMIKPTASTMRNIDLKVQIRTSEGGLKESGSMNFRVRPVPKAETLLGTKAPGNISRGELTTVQRVNAGLGATFAFEGLSMNVESFTFLFAQRNTSRAPIIEYVKGGSLTPTMKNCFLQAKRGDVIVISEVKTGGAVKGTSNGGVWTIL